MLVAPEEILEEAGGMSSEEKEELRRQARESLYFLSVGILGFKDTTVGAHGGFCRHIQASPKKRRLGLMPRSHLKSTLGTVADAIRLALAEPNEARVLIASETSTLSQKFLAQIRQHFEKNGLLRGLFPELIPPRFSGPGVTWSSDMATLNRTSTLDSPTWQAIGVGGAITGSHFTRIKCDDLIGFEAVRSPAAMASAKAWVDAIEPLLVNQNEHIIDFIGTRWSRNDLYAHIMEGYGEDLSVYTRQAVENGEIIFPALHSWKEYERIQRINPHLWHAQYENNPLSQGTNDLPIESLKSYTFSHDEQSITLQGGKTWQVEQLDRVLTADPNSGSLLAPDAAAISVQGLTPDDEVVTLDSWSGRVSPSDFVDQIYNFARRWDVRVAGIEEAGQQNTKHYFELKAERESYHVRIEALRPMKRKKEDRVRAALQPLMRSGLLYVLPSQTVLRQQIGDFPDTILWDEVDALAYGPDLWKKPEQKEKIKRREVAVNRILALRNQLTGY